MTAEQNGIFVINIFAIFYLNISISAVVDTQIMSAMAVFAKKKIARSQTHRIEHNN